MEMELEEWEFLDMGHGRGNKKMGLDPRGGVVDMNYFTCPPSFLEETKVDSSQASKTQEQVPTVEKGPDAEIGIATPTAPANMLLHQAFETEDNGNKGFDLSVWWSKKWAGIRSLRHVGVAAATLILFLLSEHQHQVCINDEIATLNQAVPDAEGAPTIAGARISFGGFGSHSRKSF